jgi:hypothetical protein
MEQLCVLKTSWHRSHLQLVPRLREHRRAHAAQLADLGADVRAEGLEVRELGAATD